MQNVGNRQGNQRRPAGHLLSVNKESQTGSRSEAERDKETLEYRRQLMGWHRKCVAWYRQAESYQQLQMYIGRMSSASRGKHD